MELKCRICSLPLLPNGLHDYRDPEPTPVQVLRRRPQACSVCGGFAQYVTDLGTLYCKAHYHS